MVNLENKERATITIPKVIIDMVEDISDRKYGKGNRNKAWEDAAKLFIGENVEYLMKKQEDISSVIELIQKEEDSK